MPEDNDVVTTAVSKRFDLMMKMGQKETEIIFSPDEGGLSDFPKRSDRFFQANLFTITVAKDSFEGAVEGSQFPGRKGSDKVAGMDDQATASILKNSYSSPDRPQIIMTISHYTNHFGPLSDRVGRFIRDNRNTLAT
jgi:hypothetical protein